MSDSTRPPRCRRVPCAAEATHVVVGDWVTRRWSAHAAEAGARYCRRHAEARAARMTAQAQPKQGVVEER